MELDKEQVDAFLLSFYNHFPYILVTKQITEITDITKTAWTSPHTRVILAQFIVLYIIYYTV